MVENDSSPYFGHFSTQWAKIACMLDLPSNIFSTTVCLFREFILLRSYWNAWISGNPLARCRFSILGTARFCTIINLTFVRSILRRVAWAGLSSFDGHTPQLLVRHFTFHLYNRHLLSENPQNALETATTGSQSIYLKISTTCLIFQKAEMSKIYF